MSSQKRKAGAQAGADAKKVKQNGSLMSYFSSPSGAKATTGGGSSGGGGSLPALPKFNKEKWSASLTPEQRQLLSLELNTMHESWLALLKDEIVSKEFLELKRFLARETAAGKKWFPPKEDVYSWSRHTPFNTVKVVIVGQDPYHNVNQAHGLAFSVRPPAAAPPSLRNMYICLKNDYPTFTSPPKNGGLLTPWADRGVLMINTCLTVRAHEANSHANRGWERFTQKVIDSVAARRTRGVVFMAWGTPAGKRVVRIDAGKHLVLKSVHPSPLSASRGFFDCGHFRLANDWLVKRYGDQGEIDWALVPGATTLEHSGEGKVAADAAKKVEAEAKKIEEEAKKVEEEAKKVEEEAKKVEVDTKKTEIEVDDKTTVEVVEAKEVVEEKVKVAEDEENTKPETEV